MCPNHAVSSASLPSLGHALTECRCVSYRLPARLCLPPPPHPWDIICTTRKALKTVGEWGLPKLRVALVTLDSNHDGAVLLSEAQDALTRCKLSVSVPLLDTYFRSLRPRIGSVAIVEFLRPFQVRAVALRVPCANPDTCDVCLACLSFCCTAHTNNPYRNTLVLQYVSAPVCPSLSLTRHTIALFLQTVHLLPRKRVSRVPLGEILEHGYVLAYHVWI